MIHFNVVRTAVIKRLPTSQYLFVITNVQMTVLFYIEIILHYTCTQIHVRRWGVDWI